MLRIFVLLLMLVENINQMFVVNIYSVVIINGSMLGTYMTFPCVS